MFDEDAKITYYQLLIAIDVIFLHNKLNNFMHIYIETITKYIGHV